jgi:hypothetical protein
MELISSVIVITSLTQIIIEKLLMTSTKIQKNFATCISVKNAGTKFNVFWSTKQKQRIPQ